MPQYTLTQASDLLQQKQASATELAQDYLNAIHAINPSINAYVHLNPELTLAQAQAADERRAQGLATPLTGVPIAYKDIFCQENWHASCSSMMLSNFVAPYTATVVQNLCDQGMVTLGRVNMDEFAMGSSNEHSHFGPTRNPWNAQHVPGGSSGGSAAAVAAGLTPAALGSDTGGSIRQPASHCGITGLKPTYGTVSRFGMIAYASSFDQAGPMAQTAQDCALLLNAMASFDERDATSVQRPNQENYTHHLNTPLKGCVIGLPAEYVNADNSEEVRTALNNASTLLQELGARLVDVSLPHTQLSVPAYYVLTSAEASSNLSRYDGVRYGHRAEQYNNLDEMYGNTRAQGFGTEVKRRIMMGTYVLSHGYYDAYYLKAQKLRRMVANDFQSVFEQCDFILAPTAPTAAPAIGHHIDPVQAYLSDVYTIAVNLAGLPALSLPSGMSTNGLPVGVQLIGNYFDEARILGAAHQMQLHSDWHTYKPQL